MTLLIIISALVGYHFGYLNAFNSAPTLPTAERQLAPKNDARPTTPDPNSAGNSVAAQGKSINPRWYIVNSILLEINKRSNGRTHSLVETDPGIQRFLTLTEEIFGFKVSIDQVNEQANYLKNNLDKTVALNWTNPKAVELVRVVHEFPEKKDKIKQELQTYFKKPIPLEQMEILNSKEVYEQIRVAVTNQIDFEENKELLNAIDNSPEKLEAEINVAGEQTQDAMYEAAKKADTEYDVTFDASIKSKIDAALRFSEQNKASLVVHRFLPHENISRTTYSYDQFFVGKDKKDNLPTSLQPIPEEGLIRDYPIQYQHISSAFYGIYDPVSMIPIVVRSQMKLSNFIGPNALRSRPNFPSIQNGFPQISFTSAKMHLGHWVAYGGKSSDPIQARDTFTGPNQSPMPADYNTRIWTKGELGHRAILLQAREGILFVGAIYDETSTRYGPYNVIMPDAYFRVLFFKDEQGKQQSVSFCIPTDADADGLPSTRLKTLEEIELMSNDQFKPNTLFPEFNRDQLVQNNAKFTKILDLPLALIADRINYGEKNGQNMVDLPDTLITSYRNLQYRILTQDQEDKLIRHAKDDGLIPNNNRIQEIALKLGLTQNEVWSFFTVARNLPHKQLREKLNLFGIKIPYRAMFFGVKDRYATKERKFISKFIHDNAGIKFLAGNVPAFVKLAQNLDKNTQSEARKVIYRYKQGEKRALSQTANGIWTSRECTETALTEIFREENIQGNDQRIYREQLRRGVYTNHQTGAVALPVAVPRAT